jgi:hypothetical protein
MHPVSKQSVKAAIRHMYPLSLRSADEYGQVPDERLSKAHLIVLEFLRVHGPSTVQQVGDACFAQTHYDKEGLAENQAHIRKRWANRVLYSLHHASRARCDHEGKWALFIYEFVDERPILSHDQRLKILAEVKLMLHASRDCMRNQGMDTTKVAFNVNDGYYGEAFGVMRALNCLRYGTLQPSRRLSPPDEIERLAGVRIGNLRDWFHEIERQVLTEEHFGGDNECDFCLERYGKDGAGRTRRTTEHIARLLKVPDDWLSTDKEEEL